VDVRPATGQTNVQTEFNAAFYRFSRTVGERGTLIVLATFRLIRKALPGNGRLMQREVPDEGLDTRIEAFVW